MWNILISYLIYIQQKIAFINILIILNNITKMYVSAALIQLWTLLCGFQNSSSKFYFICTSLKIIILKLKIVLNKYFKMLLQGRWLLNNQNTVMVNKINNHWKKIGHILNQTFLFQN